MANRITSDKSFERMQRRSVDAMESLDKLEQTALRVKRERDAYRKVLQQILCEAEEREDIEDRESGPGPNIWMRIAGEIRQALA